eukprot:scaffold1819_cov311-Prasinococcus_capsulatus_cf.AAC.9
MPPPQGPARPSEAVGRWMPRGTDRPRASRHAAAAAAVAVVVAVVVVVVVARMMRARRAQLRSRRC